MMKVVSFLIKILKYKVLSFLVSNFDILADSLQMQVFQDALKQYAKRKDKNLRMLMKYAAMFHVEKILRPYLEVLL